MEPFEIGREMKEDFCVSKGKCWKQMAQWTSYTLKCYRYSFCLSVCVCVRVCGQFMREWRTAVQSVIYIFALIPFCLLPKHIHIFTNLILSLYFFRIIYILLYFYTSLYNLKGGRVLEAVRYGLHLLRQIRLNVLTTHKGMCPFSVRWGGNGEHFQM